mgnify:FL=1
MNALGQRRTDSGHGGQFRNGGVLNAFATTEMAQERLQFLGAQPFDGLERV